MLQKNYNHNIQINPKVDSTQSRVQCSINNFPKLLENNLKGFSKKIQYHQLNIDPEKIKNEESWIIDDVKGDDAWRIENFQRNYIKTACKKFSNDDILIISDADETLFGDINDPGVLEKIPRRTPSIFQPKYSLYNI